MIEGWHRKRNSTQLGHKCTKEYDSLSIAIEMENSIDNKQCIKDGSIESCEDMDFTETNPGEIYNGVAKHVNLPHNVSCDYKLKQGALVNAFSSNFRKRRHSKQISNSNIKSKRYQNTRLLYHGVDSGPKSRLSYIYNKNAAYRSRQIRAIADRLKTRFEEILQCCMESADSLETMDEEVDRELTQLAVELNSQRKSISIPQNTISRFETIIVGGGPVGMTLAANLARRKVSFLILEKRRQRLHASRAIGIHPASLENFQALDSRIVNEWIQESITVKIGQIFSDKSLLGHARLHLARKPYNYSLATDQNKSEIIIERCLQRILSQEKINDLKAILHEFSGIDSDINDIFQLLTLYFPAWASRFQKQKEVFKIEAIKDCDPEVLELLGFKSVEDAMDSPYRYVVHYICTETKRISYAVSIFVIGCEGKNSLVRDFAKLRYEGGPLRDTFVAGDFLDNSGLGDQAAIYLSRKGLVEAFPLPGNRRRYICSTEIPIKNPSSNDIIQLVLERAHLDISDQPCTWTTKFGIQSLVVDRFFKDGLILAGDAAHICSPLGGQGMNCGFSDAFKLGEVLENILHHGKDENMLLQEYEQKQKHLAKAAINRAEINTFLGRSSLSDFKFSLRNIFIRLVLVEFYPIQWIVSMYFTMRFLGKINFGRLINI